MGLPCGPVNAPRAHSATRGVATALSLLACAALVIGCGSSHKTVRQSPTKVREGDWTRFNYDAQRSGVGPADTGITVDSAQLLAARVVHLDGTVDSAPIELHGIRVQGRARDVV